MKEDEIKKQITHWEDQKKLAFDGEQIARKVGAAGDVITLRKNQYRKAQEEVSKYQKMLDELKNTSK